MNEGVTPSLEPAYPSLAPGANLTRGQAGYMCACTCILYRCLQPQHPVDGKKGGCSRGFENCNSKW